MQKLLKYFNFSALLVTVFGFSSFISSVFVNTKLIFFVACFIALVCFLIVCLCRKIVFTFNNYQNKLLYWAIFALICLFGFSLIFSINPMQSFFGSFERGIGVFVFSVLMLVFVFNISFLKKTDIKPLVTSILLFNFVLCGYGISQFFRFDPLFKYYETGFFHGRIFSFLGNPSFLAQFVAMCLPLNLVLFKKSKRFFALSVIVSVAALVLTLTRSSILAFIAGMFLLVMKMFPKLVLRFITCSVLILISLMIFIPRFNPSNVESLNSLNSRFVIWDSTINLIKAHPEGSGVASFASVFSQVLTPEIALYEDSTHIVIDNPHNQTLGVLINFGWVGLLFYLFYVVFIAIQFFSSKDILNSAISLSLIVNLIQNQLNFFDLPSLLLSIMLFSYLILNSLKFDVTEINNKLSLILSSALLLIITCRFFVTILFANLYYSDFVHFYDYDKEYAVESLRIASNTAPFYDQFLIDLYEYDKQTHLTQLDLWNDYDKSSPRGQFYISQLSKNYDIQTSKHILESLMATNSNNYVWIRSYADVLYKMNDYPQAKYYYKLYLEMFPEPNSNSSSKLKYFYSKSPEFNYIRDRVLEL